METTDVKKQVFLSCFLLFKNSFFFVFFGGHYCRHSAHAWSFK